jgi:CheY-like chemotaxis protein
LILDDDPLVGEAMRRMLDGDDVTLLRSAGEALRGISAGERYDVILCDLMMPEMSGMQLHAELERSAPEQAKRIVFVTGGAFTRSAEAFLKRVSNRVLEKPFDAVVLRELVSGAASGRTR